MENPRYLPKSTRIAYTFNGELYLDDLVNKSARKHLQNKRHLLTKHVRSMADIDDEILFYYSFRKLKPTEE
jgi:hypothetical protein